MRSSLRALATAVTKPWRALVAGSRSRVPTGLAFDDNGFWWDGLHTPWSEVLTVKVEPRWHWYHRMPLPVRQVVIVHKHGSDEVIYVPDVGRGRRPEGVRTEIERRWLAWCKVEDAKWKGRPYRG